MGKAEVAPNVDRAVEILRTVAPFSSLPAAVLGEVLARSRSRPFARGELVVRPGDSADRVILVATGLVLLGAGTARGQWVPFRCCGPGATIGVLGLLDEGPSDGYARALTDGTAALFPADMLRNIAGRSPPFALALARKAAGLARDARYLLAESRSLEVPARLARRLLALADTFGQPAVGPSGRGQVIDLDLRHQDLADLVGASRETVSKAMGRLGSAALLRSHRGRIVLLDEAALRRVARMQAERQGDVADLA